VSIESLAALTGATGFLGRRLVRELKARGWRVRALVRRPSDESALAAEGVETVRGDLSDTESLKRLTNSAAITLNCAGLIKSRDRATFMSVNRDGAARLAEASAGRLILISSLAARAPELSDYAASKRAGEEASRAIAGDRLAVIRPPVIYGPGDRETLELFRLAERSPLTPVPNDRNARLALAHADDVANAVLQLMEQPELTNTYAAGGDRPAGYAWSEIMTAAWRAVGRKPRFAPLPAWLVLGAAFASEKSAPLRRSPPIFTRGKAREMLHADWSVSPSELAPGAPAARFSLDGGFADAVAWYREAEWL
jgi:nucleoside-diphosphate-sugar epimerase